MDDRSWGFDDAEDWEYEEPGTQPTSVTEPCNGRATAGNLGAIQDKSDRHVTR